MDFHGEKRTNATHASTIDPEARLYRRSRGSETNLGYLGHVLMENRNDMVMEAEVTIASGYAERDTAIAMIDAIPGENRMTLGGDKAYDTRNFVADLCRLNVAPYVAPNTSNRSSATDRRTTRHTG